MKRMITRLAGLLLLTLVLPAPGRAAATPAAQWDFPEPARIVAFADVHGAHEQLLALLRETGVIDAEANWAGGTTHLVSLGDLLDRGPDSRKVLDLLMRLQQQAAAAGGGVHVVLGNHETMVATGDLRYVSPGEYAAFAAEETPADRDTLFAAVVAANPAATRATFEAAFPPGRIAMQRAFGATGVYGSWLLAQPMVLKLGDSVFLHAGISDALRDRSIADINSGMQRDFAEYLGLVDQLGASGALPPGLDARQRTDYLEQALKAAGKKKPEWAAAASRLLELEGWLLFAESGPLWYRGTAQCHPYVTAFDVERSLAMWKARRVVVGHTPTTDRRVTARLGGTVILADTGMLKSAYQGRASAVVIEAGRVQVQYAGEPGLQDPVPESRAVPRQPTNMDDAALERFLLTATVVSNTAVGTGITKPRRLTLEKDGLRLDAVYKNFDTNPGLEGFAHYSRSKHDKSDRYVYDVAAYKLDRLLGIDRMPVSVLREIDGTRGLVQLWLTGTINERDRLERKVPFTGLCPQDDQYRLRILWDVLVHNDDRNLTNLLWTDDDFTLLFIDHSLAFRSSVALPKAYAKVNMNLSEALRTRLQALDEPGLTALLGSYLNPEQIRAILERRDMILREANGTGFSYR